MPKQPPKWQQAGLTKVGPGKYKDENGKAVSERQMRKLVGTPAKGSQGAYEYRKQRYGAEFAGLPPKPRKSYTERLKEFLLKTPGGTEKWFQTGQAPTMSHEEMRIKARHNAAIDKQRLESLRAHKKAGLITEKEYNSQLATYRLYQSYRDKVVNIQERIRTRARAVAERRAKPFTQKEIERLKKDQDTYVRIMKGYTRKGKQIPGLDQKVRDMGIVPDIEEFEYSWWSP